MAPKTPPKIRDLEWTDLDAFLEMYWALYEERARGDPIGIHLYSEPPSRSDEVAWFSHLYREVLDGETICAVAERDGRAVGHCEIHPIARRGSETDHVGELGIIVDARFRGQGCGTALIRRALEIARSRFELVRLTVFATNSRAKRLYERIGFTPTGRLPSAVHRGDRYIDLEMMCLDLRPDLSRTRGPNH